jgi:hypothetical protein
MSKTFSKQIDKKLRCQFYYSSFSSAVVLLCIVFGCFSAMGVTKALQHTFCKKKRVDWCLQKQIDDEIQNRFAIYGLVANAIKDMRALSSLNLPLNDIGGHWTDGISAVTPEGTRLGPAAIPMRSRIWGHYRCCLWKATTSGLLVAGLWLKASKAQ